MKDVEVNKVVEYTEDDITLQLKHKLAPMLKDSNLDSLFNDVEIPLMHVLADVENNGVRIDTEALSKMSKELEAKALALPRSSRWQARNSMWHHPSSWALYSLIK